MDISVAETDPDDIVLNVSKNNLGDTPKVTKEEYIIHSTSWRYEKKNSIVLTYLIYSDFLDFGSNLVKTINFSDLVIAKGVSHKKPRPNYITETNILAHAIRHLAYLLKHNDNDDYGRVLMPTTINRLKELSEIPAGELVK